MRDFFFVKSGRKFTRVLFADVQYAEAMSRYVKLITSRREHLVMTTLGQVEKLFPTDIFCRVHRSYIISLRHTVEFEYEMATIGNKQIPIGRQYRSLLLGKINLLGSEAAEPNLHVVSLSQLTG
jgi:two-component system, LytTR family, response regulator